MSGAGNPAQTPERDHCWRNIYGRDGHLHVEDWPGSPAPLLAASHNWSDQTTYQDAHDN